MKLYKRFSRIELHFIMSASFNYRNWAKENKRDTKRIKEIIDYLDKRYFEDQRENFIKLYRDFSPEDLCLITYILAASFDLFGRIAYIGDKRLKREYPLFFYFYEKIK